MTLELPNSEHSAADKLTNGDNRDYFQPLPGKIPPNIRRQHQKLTDITFICLWAITLKVIIISTTAELYPNRMCKFAIWILLYPKAKRILFILADGRFIFKRGKQSFAASAAEEVPWLFSHLLSLFWCPVSAALLPVRRRLQITSVSWSRLRFRASVSQSPTPPTAAVAAEWCLPSGATHAGEYILPGHWKENLTSAMLILAVISSSICGCKEKDSTLLSTSLLSCRTIVIGLIRSCGWQMFVLTSVLHSHHHTPAVEIVARDHWFKCV